MLLVNVHALHRISKYKDKESEPPKIYKLGSGAWQRMKLNTKKAVKDIARELIALYAKRKASEGFAYSPDSYLQHELEASFIYEDTPDQQTATQLSSGYGEPHADGPLDLRRRRLPQDRDRDPGGFQGSHRARNGRSTGSRTATSP